MNLKPSPLTISLRHSRFLCALLMHLSVVALIISGSARADIVSDLYVGSNNSLQTTNFTSGTTSYSNAYVGYSDSNNTTPVTNNTLVVNGSNAVLNLYGNDNIGYNGYNGSRNGMIVTNGGTVTDSNAYVGYSNNNAYAIITGSNSTWSNSSFLTVGSQGAGNSLVISNGGSVYAASLSQGISSNSSNNSVVVDGVGSKIQVSGTLNIANGGDYNTFVITNGGLVSDSNAYIAGAIHDSNNVVTVTGGGSLWTNSGNITVGQFGSYNTLIISNGGHVVDINGFIDSAAPIGSSNNTVIVTGAGSLWSNSASTYVGFNGSSNRLTISAGGHVVDSNGFVDLIIASSNNSVLVTDSGSLWSNSATLTVGNNGSGNTLTISNAGQVIDSNAIIGNSNTALNNTVTVTGTGSLWSNSGILTVGSSGSGTLTVANGGSVAANAIMLASNSGSIGTLNIGTLGGRDTAVSLVTPSLAFGAGIGTLNFNQSDKLTLAATITGTNVASIINQLGTGTTVLSGSNAFAGLVTVDGGQLFISGTLTNVGTLTVGKSNASVSMVISNAQVSDSNATVGLGSNSSNNTVMVTGQGALWSNTGILTVGDFGAGNSLIISNNGQVVSSDGVIGNQSSSSNNSVTVTGSNSLWSNTGLLFIAAGAGNSLTVTNGGEVTANYLGIQQGAGTASNIISIGGSNSRAIIGGVVEIGSTASNSGAQLLVSGGGKLTNGGNAVIGTTNGTAVGNYVSVSGSNSAWNIGGNFLFGNGSGSNTLVIANGGGLANSNGYIGIFGSSNNSATVTGSGSLWTNSADFYVGQNGSSNSLTISGGAQVLVHGRGYIGSTNYSNASYNTVLLTGSNSLWMNGNGVVVGGAGTGNTLVVSDSALLVSSNKVRMGYLATSSNNSLTVNGGSITAGSTEVDVGYGGAGNTLLITNGGKVTNGSGFLGVLNTSTNNSALVTGAGSLWTNSGALYVGVAGSGTLTVANGGSVAANAIMLASNSGSIGTLNIGTLGGRDTAVSLVTPSLAFGAGIGTLNFNQSDKLTLAATITGTNVASIINQLGSGTTVLSGSNAFTGLVTVDGGQLFITGTLTNVGTLTVGKSNPSVSMVISNAQVSDNTSYIGYSSNSSNNSVLVTGSNAVWSNSVSLYVGYAGSSNSLTISSGAHVYDANGYLDGLIQNSSNNWALVTGSNSLWSNSASLYVGVNGSGNKLTISDGAVVADLNGYVDDLKSTNASNNSVLVTGSNSVWTNSGGLTVGLSAQGNSLKITNGGSVYAAYFSEGASSNSSNNSVVVDGSGSKLQVSGSLWVANGGDYNTFRISGGGLVSDVDGLIAGSTADSNNVVTVTGPGSLWSNSGNLTVGEVGSYNTLIISNGGHVVDVNGYIDPLAPAGSSNNAVVVTDSGSLWSNSANLTVGNNGSGNTLTISNGGQVVDATGIIGNSIAASNNTVTVTGTGSLLSNSGNFTVGSSGSGNSLIVSNGGQVLNAGGYIGFAADAFNNSVTVTGNGSKWLNSGSLYVGYAGQSNKLVISSGGFVSNVNGFDDGLNPADGYNSVLVTGTGSQWSNSGNLTFGLAGHDNSLVVSNGGSVGVAGALMIGDQRTATKNSVLVTGYGSSLASGGAMTIGNSGSGTLTVANGASVTASAITLSANGGSSGTLNIGTLGGSDTAGTITASSIAFGSGNSTLNFNQSDTVTLASSISGLGSVWQRGNGTTILSGNNTYRGGTYIRAGTVVAASTNAFGTSTVNLGNSPDPTLKLAANLTVSTFNWGSNGVIAMTPGSQLLTITNGFYNQLGSNSVGAGIFDFGGATAANSNPITLIAFDHQYGFSSNCFSVAGSTNWGFILTANTLQTFYLAVNSGLIAYPTMTIDSVAATYSSVTFLPDGILNITPTGNLTITSDVTVSNNGIVLLNGVFNTPNLNILPGSLLIGGGTLNDALNNAGTIIMQGMTINEINGGVVNSGVISGFGTINGSVSNSGQILMTNLTINAQSGGVTNSGLISGVGIINGNFTQTATGTYNAGGALNGNVSNAGQIVMNNLVITGAVNNTGTLSGVGAINGAVTSSGTLMPGSTTNIGTIAINGNLVLTSTSGLIIPVTTTGNSQITVNGAANLSGTLTLLPLPGTTLSYGQQIAFLSSTGPIKGSFSAINTPAGYRGRLSIVGDPVAYLLIAPQSYTQLAMNRNQSNVASALNSFIPSASGDQLTVSTLLDSLTAGQYQQAFNAIMPSFYQSISTIAFNLANAQNSELVQRLWGLRVAESGGFTMSGLPENTPMAQEQPRDGKGVLDAKRDILRPGEDNHWGMFVDGNGILAQANSGNMLPGYNSQSGGVTTGLTYKWNQNFSSGIYAGYEGTYAKYGANGSGLGVGSRLIDNSVRFGLFGTYGQKNSKGEAVGFYADAMAGGGYNNYQATRIIQFSGLNRTANSSPGAGELDSMLAGGYDIKKGPFTFGPTASLQYTYLGVNPVSETGAQSLNFSSGGWNSSSMLSSIGAHAAYTWQAGKNIVVVPQISLNWQHEFMQNPYAINGTLGGTSPTFSNWSSTPIRDTLYTGVGFTVEFARKWNTSFFYNASAGNSDLVSQNIFWSAGVKF